MDSVSKPKILFCDDDTLCHRSIILSLGESFDFVCCTSVGELMAMMSEERPDLVLLDIGLKGKDDGFTAIPHLLSRWPAVPIVIYSGAPLHEAVLRAWRLGARDYIPKTAPPAEIENQITVALRRSTTADVMANAVGESPAFQELQSWIARLRERKGNVIVTGERGVGKELAARALRKGAGTPAAEPFEVLNAGSIHRGTAESELFGHERGAFTGATSARAGIFERAHGGIVFLDEVVHMPLDLQASLLRVIQEQEVMRIGARSPRKLSFRVVCATNKDLEAACQRKEFHSDLLDRLAVHVLRVPPLRERKSDIPILVEHFLRCHGAPNREYVVSDAVWDMLTQYDWPGNIRELSNVVENAATRCDDGTLRPEHILDKLHVALATTTTDPSDDCEFASEQEPGNPFGSAMATASSDALGADAPIRSIAESGKTFVEHMKECECGLLVRELQIAEGSVSRMASNLKLHRSCVYKKLQAHGIDPSRWSEG